MPLFVHVIIVPAIWNFEFIFGQLSYQMIALFAQVDLIKSFSDQRSCEYSHCFNRTNLSLA